MGQNGIKCPTMTWNVSNAVHKTGQDQVRLLPQLLVHPSCDLVEWCKLRIMRIPILPPGEWFTSLTRRTRFAVMCLLFVPCSIYPFLCTWGKQWRAPLVVMLGVKMADDIIYRDLSPVGNLTNHKPALGRYNHLSRMINDLTSPVEREPMTSMSHVAYYSWTRTPGNCVASTL